MEDIQKLKEMFVTAAIKHGEGTEQGNHKLANKQYKIIEKSINELKSIENGIDEFEGLLEHEVDYVRLWCARYLLASRNMKAKRALSELISKPGFLGLTAKLTLDEWDKGNIL